MPLNWVNSYTMASNGRKAKDDKGYDHKFMDPVPNELLCLICLLPARDPQQSTCCGKVFCEACVNELKKHSNKCPGCRGDMNCFPDKRSKSHVAQHIKPSLAGQPLHKRGRVWSTSHHEFVLQSQQWASSTRCA